VLGEPSYAKRCVPSTEVAVTIKDPCLDTEIMPFGPGNQILISVPLLAEGTFNLRDAILAIPNNYFPWPNSVAASVDPAIYGPGVCGPIAYNLEQIQNTTPLAFLNDQTMDVTVRPIKGLVEHEIGEYTIYLRGTLTDYGFSKQVPFKIQVTACEAVLDASAVVLGEINNMWYSPVATYNISLIGPDVKQYPDCCHPLSYQAFWYDIDADTLNPLPVEISFSDNQIRISKCNPIGVASPNDQQCNDGTIPYTKSYKLALKITMNDGILNDKVQYVYTDAVIYDPCTQDNIRFLNTVPALDYSLKPTPVPATYSPTFSQDFALCPIECAWLRTDTLEYGQQVV